LVIIVMGNQNLNVFFEKLNRLAGDKSLIKLVLSNQRDRTSDLKSIIITLLEIKKGTRLNFVYRYKTRDITKNFSVDEAIVLIRSSLADDFFNADLFSSAETFRVLITDQGKVKIRSNQPQLKPVDSFGHDRLKERVIPFENNIYLRELGVLNSNFEVRHEMNDKYLQINRYIELLSPFIRDLNLPAGFHVADMGSGKGYLTFALYDYLVKSNAAEPVMTGVETRPELVKLCNEIAGKAAFKGLKFIKGNIRDAILDKVDILIALHACDTATDDAIYRGITSGASLIVCAPCCHKQVRKDFKVAGAFSSITKHGILEERQAEIVTDGIRALIMESQGYKTQVFEFISSEHTAKNLMIVGRKTTITPAAKKKSLESIRVLKEMFGVREHYLEGLMRDGCRVTGDA
jgi:hypothetical protein